MNNTVFAENLKKFRIAKNLTQEQAATALCVTAQTISRWECGSTLPDVLTLPKLAKLYAVTVDDFYKKQSIAYDNYAQRLSAVYEKTRDPEDFLRAVYEFKKLIQEGELSQADKWQYAFVYHAMLHDCKDAALEWYDKAIADGAEKDIHSYRRARSLRAKLLSMLGKGGEVIDTQKKKNPENPSDPEEWSLLMEAYIWADRYDKVYDQLPVSCFQGDLNDTNILIDRDHRFAGVIDFNVCGREPVLNYAVREALMHIDEKHRIYQRILRVQ